MRNRKLHFAAIISGNNSSLLVYLTGPSPSFNATAWPDHPWSILMFADWTRRSLFIFGNPHARIFTSSQYFQYHLLCLKFVAVSLQDRFVPLYCEPWAKKETSMRQGAAVVAFPKEVLSTKSQPKIKRSAAWHMWNWWSWSLKHFGIKTTRQRWVTTVVRLLRCRDLTRRISQTRKSNRMKMKKKKIQPTNHHKIYRKSLKQHICLHESSKSIQKIILNQL